jgi:hypothetical protein
LHSVLATLEQCRAALIERAELETAQLVSLAILQLRLKLNRISDAELKALCNAMTPEDGPAGRSGNPKSPQGQRQPSPSFLKLVK